MRFDREQLVWKALVALDEAAELAKVAPIADRHGLRFLLAYLYSVSNGERAFFEMFWRSATKDRLWDGPSGVLARPTHIESSLLGIARCCGVSLIGPNRDRLKWLRLPADQRRAAFAAEAERERAAQVVREAAEEISRRIFRKRHGRDPEPRG